MELTTLGSDATQILLEKSEESIQNRATASLKSELNSYHNLDLRLVKVIGRH